MKRSAVLLWIALVSLSSVCSAGQYRIHDLGTLGGAYSGAYDVNNAGQVVGYSALPGYGGSHAFLWQNGHMQDLGALAAGSSSTACAINDSGVTIGDSGYPSHVFTWDGGMQDMGTFGWDSSHAVDISASGQLLVRTYTTGSYSPCLVWYQGTQQVVGSLSAGYASYARKMNDLGHVVGDSTTDIPASEGFENHAFLWRDGTTIDLGTLGGAGSCAMALNNSDAVVGYSEPASGYGCLPFLWANGEMHALATLGDMDTQASDINNRGQVVGFSYNGVWNDSRALTWDNGAITVLESLGGTDTKAYAINDNGWIAGYATDTAGNGHAVLWTPVPEPSSIVTMIAALAMAAGTARRRIRPVRTGRTG